MEQENNVSENKSNNLTPKEIVAQLDTYIIGQHKAKKAVAIALRNRQRRLKLPQEIRDEVAPKNILMIPVSAFLRNKAPGILPAITSSAKGRQIFQSMDFRSLTARMILLG